MRFVESGSSILRNSDSAIFSILFHGEIVIQELSCLHFKNSAHPDVGSSHGNSARNREKKVVDQMDSYRYLGQRIWANGQAG